MRLTLVSTQLADSTVLTPHSGITLNGRQLVDDAEFFRAATARVFARGNFGTTLQFSVTHSFSSQREAEVFFLTQPGSVPTSGLVTAICGVSGDTQTCYLEDAVVESVALPPYKGVSVEVQYTIRGGLWTSDVPAELPGTADSPETTIVMRRGRVSITSGDSSVVVTFSAALSSVPTVTASISRPTGGDAIWAIIREDSVTTSGFTADLSGATPASGYKLNYIAVE